MNRMILISLAAVIIAVFIYVMDAAEASDHKRAWNSGYNDRAVNCDAQASKEFLLQAISFDETYDYVAGCQAAKRGE